MSLRKQHNQFIAVGLVEPRDARQRIDAAPEPDRDCICTRELNHLGRCKFVYSPLIRDFSWKEGVL